MIVIKQHGTLKKTTKFLKKLSKQDYFDILDKFGRAGVRALASATPIDSGETANSWDYKVDMSRNGAAIYWTNSHIVNGVPIAVILQYGHGTRNGGYVQGIDYINPAMKPIFDKLAQDAWQEVTDS